MTVTPTFLTAVRQLADRVGDDARELVAAVYVLADEVERLTAEVEHLRANQRVNHATVETGPGNRLDFYGGLPTRAFEP